MERDTAYGTYDTGRNDRHPKKEHGQVGPRWTRYGMSELEWDALAPDQRVIHYNRQNVCEHKADLSLWPSDLWDSYSRDPYSHIAHMIPCKKYETDKCDCQMCVGRIGQLDSNATNLTQLLLPLVIGLGIRYFAGRGI